MGDFISGATEDDVDDGIDVGDIDFSITVHVAEWDVKHQVFHNLSEIRIPVLLSSPDISATCADAVRQGINRVKYKQEKMSHRFYFYLVILFKQ